MDFNVRNYLEQVYIDTPEIVDFIDLFVQEIDILFNTDKYEIFGKNDFGIDIEKKLWKTNIRADLLASDIEQAIINHCESQQFFDFTVDVKMIRGISRDIGVVEITIKENQLNPVEVPITFIYR